MLRKKKLYSSECMFLITKYFNSTVFNWLGILLIEFSLMFRFPVSDVGANIIGSRNA
jgi:hypothetical protein